MIPIQLAAHLDTAPVSSALNELFEHLADASPEVLDRFFHLFDAITYANRKIAKLEAA